jgi:hypothetical protein
MAVVANSQLLFSVNGVVNPPDSSITLRPSDIVIIDLVGDGKNSTGPVAMGISANSQGPGSLDVSKAVLPFGGLAVMMDNADIAMGLGIQNPFIYLDLPGGQVGTLAGGIDFHCDGPGDVTISLVDWDGNIIDSQVIHQIPIPEPATIALLALGGLALLRKRNA